MDSEFDLGNGLCFVVKEEIRQNDVEDISNIFKKYEDYIKETCCGDWTFTWEIYSNFWDKKVFLKIYFAFTNEQDFLVFKLRWKLCNSKTKIR